MTARPATGLWLHAGLALGGLVGGLLLARPALIAVAAAPALLLIVALTTARPPQVRVVSLLARPRLIEGEQVRVTLTVESTAPGQMVVDVDVPHGLTPLAGGRWLLRVRAGEPQTLELRLRAAAWGAYDVGSVTWRVCDPTGLLTFEGRGEDRSRLLVYPAVERLRSLVAPYRTQPVAGQRVSRAAGEGIELAELRPLYPGDSLRAVNWRASARRQTLITNQRHPERNADVVLFLDTFTEVDPALPGTLDRQVRAAAAVATALLARRDRVGLIGFGGVLSWLRPGAGMRHWYRLVEILLGSRVLFSEAWKGIDLLPLRALPPQALVVALTPLLDERSIAALLDLRGRGTDLAIIEVPPGLPLSRPASHPEVFGDLAWRLWRMEREMLRQRFQRIGVAHARWAMGQPIEPIIAEVIAFRRNARPSPA